MDDSRVSRLAVILGACGFVVCVVREVEGRLGSGKVGMGVVSELDVVYVGTEACFDGYLSIVTRGGYKVLRGKVLSLR